MKDRELLNYALEHGMIDMSYVQEQIEMNKRKELLEKHPYKIWQGKDGKWYTYIPNKEKGRKLLKKTEKKLIEDIVVDYWKVQIENPTIEDVFNEWNDRRLSLKKISPGSHLRYIQTFNRHFQEFGKKHIKTTDPDDYIEFLENETASKDLTAKAFSALKLITKGLLIRAKKRKFISFNVEEIFQESDINESDFKKNVKKEELEVFNEQEFSQVVNYLENHLDVKNVGILLMFLTGIRVGELVALKHSDFNETVFLVQRTETRVPKESGGYEYLIKDTPKTAAGIRQVIIPSDYAWLIKKIRSCNPFGEYVFEENGKRYTTNSIRRRMRAICNKLGIIPKSPHKIRKTYGSILLDNGIDNKLITEVMGHTDIACTEEYYHRNRRTIQKKSEIISNIPEFKCE